METEKPTFYQADLTGELIPKGNCGLPRLPAEFEPESTFEVYVKKGQELRATIPGLGEGSVKETLPISREFLLRTISSVYRTPIDQISPDQVNHGLYLLCKSWGWVELLDAASCRFTPVSSQLASVSAEVLEKRLRFSLRQRGRTDESENFANAYLALLEEAVAAQPQTISTASPPLLPELVRMSTSAKGNLDLLRGTDDRFKRAVTLHVAGRFGGVTLRAIQDAAKNRKLATEGTPPHRKVLVESLLKYFPSEK